jgi:hypothetical protein
VDVYGNSGLHKIKNEAEVILHKGERDVRSSAAYEG